MSDLLSPLELIPLLILLAEMLAAVLLSRRRIARRVVWIMGSYLIFVAVAVAFGSTFRDEFGYSWIPLLTFTEPWTLLLRSLSNSLVGFTQSLYGITIGILINCAIFFLIDQLSYPKHSIKAQATI